MAALGRRPSPLPISHRFARWRRGTAYAARGALPALALATLCAFGAPRSARAQHPLLSLPLDDPAYQQLDALDRSGCRVARIGAMRPLFVRDVRRAVAAATRDPSCAPLLVDALQRRFLPDTAAPRDSSRALLGDTARIALDSLARVDSLRRALALSSAGGMDSIGARPGLDAGGMLTLSATALSDSEFRPLWRDFVSQDSGTPPLVATVRGRLRYSAGPRFLAVSEVYVESSRRNDWTARAKTLRRSTGIMDVGESYLTGQLGPIVLSFGRSADAWLGDGRESIALSANHPLMDRLLVTGRWAHVEARAIVGVLDDDVLDETQDSLAIGEGSIRLHRGFVAHALTWMPVSALELTVGETMLFTRRGLPLDFAYYNPLVPYVVAQNDTARAGAEGRDNVLLFGGVRGRIGPAVLEGELIVDDIQVDARDASRTQSQLGYRLRATAPLPLDQPTIASLEYRRLDSFTYSRGFYSEAYQYYGAPLGSELGPDADMLSGELTRWPNGLVQLSVGASLWRHGATRLDRRPSESPNFQAGRPFPSTRPLVRPEVQQGVIWNGGARLATGRLPITAQVELARISSVNNQPVPAALYVRLNIVGSYALKYP